MGELEAHELACELICEVPSPSFLMKGSLGRFRLCFSLVRRFPYGPTSIQYIRLAVVDSLFVASTSSPNNLRWTVGLEMIAGEFTSSLSDATS